MSLEAAAEAAQSLLFGKPEPPQASPPPTAAQSKSSAPPQKKNFDPLAGPVYDSNDGDESVGGSTTTESLGVGSNEKHASNSSPPGLSAPLASSAATSKSTCSSAAAPGAAAPAEDSEERRHSCRGNPLNLLCSSAKGATRAMAHFSIRTSSRHSADADRKSSSGSMLDTSILRARLSADGHARRSGQRLQSGAQDARAQMLSRHQNTYGYAQRRSVVATAQQIQRQVSQRNLTKGVASKFKLRRISSSSLADASRHDSYKFDGEESKVHFDRRFSLPENHKRNLKIVHVLMVSLIGSSLGLLAAGMNLAVYYIHSWTMSVVQYVTWLPDGTGMEPMQPNVGLGLAVFLGLHIVIVSGAAALTMWKPLAANSGLPKLKSFLNGTYLRGGMLSFGTLIAKVIGITLVVASGLPLGKEGPMVHIGAMVAAIVTRFRWPGTGRMLELRLPQPQREWIGMGAAAGVAAAFNAPFGGILYSFEEVCSHWTKALTWRSFACTMIVAMTYKALVEVSGGELNAGFHTGLEIDATTALFTSGAVFWVILIGALGGAVGASYNLVVLFVNRVRERIYALPQLYRRSSGRSSAGSALDEQSVARRTGSTADDSPPRQSNRRPSMTDLHVKGNKKEIRRERFLQACEAVVLATCIFALYFLLPIAFACTECPPPNNTSNVASGSRKLAELPSLGGCVYTGHRPHVRHTCADGEYSELGTLLLSGQEGMLNHLLSRHDVIGGNPTFSLTTLAVMLAFYFAIATITFGIHVPAGNFVPGIAIGAALGRLVGQVLTTYKLDFGWEPGAYALLGAAAVLSGMTRMTLTLAAILVEVADDIRLMPAIMLVLSVANLVSEQISISFDEAMMRLQGLPYLDEAPPPDLSMLTAQNAMASPVIVLPEVAQVDFLAKIIDTTSHNGFPVVRLDHSTLKMASASDASMMRSKAKFCGMILRRQLLVLLQERVWEYQHKDKDPPQRVIERFVGSFSTFADADLGGEHMKTAKYCKLKSGDMDKLLDLRSFMDPSPLTIGKLMPLSRVYRLFNEIGVRHLPVLDPQYRVAGMITRKDLHIENMENTVLRLAVWTEDMKSGVQQPSQLKSDGLGQSFVEGNVYIAARQLRASQLRNEDEYLLEDDESDSQAMDRYSREIRSLSDTMGNEFHPNCSRILETAELNAPRALSIEQRLQEETRAKPRNSSNGSNASLNALAA